MPEDDSKRVHINIPAAFLTIVDEAARANFMTRTQFVHLALLEKIGGYNLNGSKTMDAEDDPDLRWQKFIDGLDGH